MLWDEVGLLGVVLMEVPLHIVCKRECLQGEGKVASSFLIPLSGRFPILACPGPQSLVSWDKRILTYKVLEAYLIFLLFTQAEVGFPVFESVLP